MTVVVDTHVHWPDDVALSDILDQSYRNFAAVAPGATPAMMVADTSARSSQAFWQVVRNRLDGTSWRVDLDHADAAAAWIERDGQRMVIVAGAQLQTAERLEVLSFGTGESAAQGQSLADTVEQSLRSGRVVVLPWGVGKWLGARGGVLRRVLERVQSGPLFVGDNGGRPWIWPGASLQKLAEFTRKPVLHGTDPLPTPGDWRRIGTYATCLAGDLTPANLWPQLLALLDVSDGQHRVGSLSNVRDFLQRQAAMRRLSNA